MCCNSRAAGKREQRARFSTGTARLLGKAGMKQPAFWGADNSTDREMPTSVTRSPEMQPK